MRNKRITIIGSGIAGMTAAIHLARSGFKVTVLEKNDNPGGRCDRLCKDGHTFDTGPTLLVMPLLYEAEFGAMGVSMNDLLDLQRVDPTYHLVFDDGQRLALTSDLKSMYDQLDKIEPGSFQGLLRYLDEGHRHYNLGMENLVYPDFRVPSDFFKLSNLPLLYQVKPLVKHYKHMRAFFDNPRLKAAFTFQDVYMGLSPFNAPATFSMMAYTELAHGVWYPKGGMYRVTEALHTLALEAGVKFHFATKVSAINIDGSEATGVTLCDGEILESDAVLANADLSYVYQRLLPQDRISKRMAKKRHSCSVISYFWGLDKQYPRLDPHTLFLADDYRQNFDSIVDDLNLPENPSLYIHAPSRLDPSMAPAGEDTLIAIVPVGHMSKDLPRKWDAVRETARQHVFRRLKMIGVHDLEKHIKFEINFTPPSWRKRYNLVNGSTHGLSHNLTQLGIFRPDLNHPRYRNLFFTGASTRPGTGIPTAMISGRHAATRLIDQYS
jgi:phytoene desaturase